MNSKIMVIEEDGAMRTLICGWLSAIGHQVRSIPKHDGLSDKTIDLVILDLPNPRSGRSETMNAVYAVRIAYPHASVIGISTQVGRSLPRGSDVTRAFGIQCLLAKPCSRSELLAAVAKAR